jgi:hypothetical protein
MLFRLLAYLVLAQVFLCGVLLRKPILGQQPASGLRTSAGGTTESKRPATAAGRVSPSGDSGWLPPEVDENVPPVEPGSACNLEEVVQKAGQRVQEFVGSVERFTATESLLHETINKSGTVSERKKRKYNYMVSIEEIRPGILAVEENLSGSSTPFDSPGGIINKGLPALILIFHPYYAGNFSMRCEGLATLNGKPAWQIYFRQGR